MSPSKPNIFGGEKTQTTCPSVDGVRVLAFGDSAIHGLLGYADGSKNKVTGEDSEQVREFLGEFIEVS